ncbi:MAG: hypothetical protein AAFO01_18740 [Pseudomonadota bacterium]
MSTHRGILAIWNSCKPGKEQDYETWYQTEHLDERLSIAGFRRGRRYESIARHDGYFTYYETDSPDVLTSNAYLQRVNHPTPMTARIMSETFTDMSRTVCKRTFMLGHMHGVFAATLQLPHLPDKTWLGTWAKKEMGDASIARIEGWEAVGERLDMSVEARLRGGDDRIETCLFVETLREAECLKALEHLMSELGHANATTGVYRLLCDLTSQGNGMT